MNVFILLCFAYLYNFYRVFRLDKPFYIILILSTYILSVLILMNFQKSQIIFRRTGQETV